MIKIVLILQIFIFQSLVAQEIVGAPKIIDGDTIHINSYKIRLEGIDAPEMKQMCKKDEKDYLCGLYAKNKIKEKIGKKKIRCISSGIDRYKRHLGTCFTEETNLNKWMVKNGYAVAYRRFSKTYVSDEEFAKLNRLGLWAGSFTQPEKWRKLN